MVEKLDKRHFQKKTVVKDMEFRHSDGKTLVSDVCIMDSGDFPPIGGASILKKYWCLEKFKRNGTCRLYFRHDDGITGEGGRGKVTHEYSLRVPFPSGPKREALEDQDRHCDLLDDPGRSLHREAPETGGIRGLLRLSF